MSELPGSNHQCRAQFKCAQTVVGQRFDGNGPNGLSYYYYHYYYKIGLRKVYYYYIINIMIINNLKYCSVKLNNSYNSHSNAKFVVFFFGIREYYGDHAHPTLCTNYCSSMHGNNPRCFSLAQLRIRQTNVACSPD